MIKNCLYITILLTLLSSCGPKEYSACDCQKAMASDAKTSETVVWCEAKKASDKSFEEAIAKCAAEEMGFDTSKMKVETNTSLAAGAGSYSVNTAKSSVKWTGRKPLGSHTGQVAIKSGEFAVGADGVMSSGTIVMDMTSITVTDIKDEKSNGDLVGHLKAEDFFGTANHPEATFSIKEAKLMDGEAKTNYQVTGDLTIKGITKPVSAVLMMVQSKTVKGNVSVAGGLKFDRTDYDIKYNSGKFFDKLGDKAISDDVTLQITLVASK